jgi:hypothetical protein
LRNKSGVIGQCAVAAAGRTFGLEIIIQAEITGTKIEYLKLENLLKVSIKSAEDSDSNFEIMVAKGCG